MKEAIRSPQAVGNHHLGLVVAWDCATANVPNPTFHPLIQEFADRMVVLSDTGFHAATGDPVNLKCFGVGRGTRAFP